VLIIGVIALILFPILMARRPNPLVPLGLFKSRAFATINLATFFVYGALYVNFSYQSLLLQGVLGYSALAAGAVGVPAGALLALLSARVGTIAGRIGARRFLLVGPSLMALATLWWARVPTDSAAWQASLSTPSTLLPPSSVLIDVLPAILLNGVGISLVVAPLTATLMSSIPGRFSGLGSAINNSISRVGQPLLGAILFIAVSATFYAVLGAHAPGLDVDSESVRTAFSPLNPAPGSASDVQAAATAEASIAAFHLAMLVSTVLLVVGGLVSWFGLRPTQETRRAAGAAAAEGSG
jgi:predicted MFS family arabinose efflux permease